MIPKGRMGIMEHYFNKLKVQFKDKFHLDENATHPYCLVCNSDIDLLNEPTVFYPFGNNPYWYLHRLCLINMGMDGIVIKALDAMRKTHLKAMARDSGQTEFATEKGEKG